MANEPWPYFSAQSGHSRRSAVHSSKGIVSCSQPLAAECGIKILNQGGNCADAAVAVAAALNVVEPAMSGIGGDMFCVFKRPSGPVMAINGSGRSPANLTLQTARDDLSVPDGMNGKIPYSSGHSVTVPGAVGGWIDTIDAFGSGKLTLKEILAPAIDLAENGFPVSQISSLSFNTHEARLKNMSPNFGEVLKKDPSVEHGCRAPKPGEWINNHNLARSLKGIAEKGKAGYYSGRIAQEVVDAARAKGSVITLDDLTHHMDDGPTHSKPISLRFNGQGIPDKARGQDSMSQGVELWEHQPNGQGLVVLMALGILQILEKQGKIKTFTAQDHNSPEYLHAIIEVLRIAFADGIEHISDPDYAPVSPQSLLSEPYLTSRAKLFNPAHASPLPTHGSPALTSTDTTYLAITDPEGNAISLITSVYDVFGTGIVPFGCGFPLQNRGSGFVLGPPDHANILAPRKRPYHTIIPAMITNVADGSLNAVLGVVGSYMQPQAQVQVFFNMFVFGMDPQTAIDAPRVLIQANDDDSREPDTSVSLEDGVDEETARRLKEMGHVVKILKGQERRVFGTGQIIRRSVDPVEGTVVWSAGSDGRGDGHAVPLI